jgi:hypothetical protein
MGSFAAQVKAWGEKAKRNTTLVFRESVQSLARDLTYNTPLVTSNLRRSLMSSTVAMPTVKDGSFLGSDTSGQTEFTIAGLEVGDTFYLGFQAKYARRVNYGFTGTDILGRNYNQSGQFFVEATAAKWQSFVNAAVARVNA